MQNGFGEGVRGVALSRLYQNLPRLSSHWGLLDRHVGARAGSMAARWGVHMGGALAAWALVLVGFSTMI